MIDFEDLILDRQERMEFWEDGCFDYDQCENCSQLSKCRNASEGKGEYPLCPYQCEGNER